MSRKQPIDKKVKRQKRQAKMIFLISTIKNKRYEQNPSTALPILGKVAKGATPHLRVKNDKANYIHRLSEAVPFVKHDLVVSRPQSTTSSKLTKKAIYRPKVKKKIL